MVNGETRMADGNEDADESTSLVTSDCQHLVGHNRAHTTEIDWSRVAADFAWDWKHIFVAVFFSFLPSAVDVITDGLAGWYFYNGTDYIKHVADPNDISVSDNQSCTLTGKFVNITENGTEVVDYYEYRCFEWDVMYGLVTWGIMLLPVLMPLPMALPVLLEWEKGNPSLSL